MFSSIVLKSDTLAIPALLSASSALLLLVNFILTRKRKKDEADHHSPAENVSTGFIVKLRHHANHYGGLTIFTWRILRLLAVLHLVVLAVATLIFTKDFVSDYTHRARVLNWSVLGSYVSIPWAVRHL